MRRLLLTSMMLALITSAYSANCPVGFQICWTGDSKFGEWVASVWSETQPWSAWQSVLPFSVPSPLAGKDDYAYDAMSYQYYRTRTEDRAGKDQWEQRDCDDGVYEDFWGIVLTATYARTAKEIRNIIRVTITDCSDPDNIYVIETVDFSDVTTPFPGIKTLAFHQEPATAQCEG